MHEAGGGTRLGELRLDRVYEAVEQLCVLMRAAEQPVGKFKRLESQETRVAIPEGGVLETWRERWDAGRRRRNRSGWVSAGKGWR